VGLPSYRRSDLEEGSLPSGGRTGFLKGRARNRRKHFSSIKENKVKGKEGSRSIMLNEEREKGEGIGKFPN